MTVGVYAFTAGVASATASPVRRREYLGIFNQSGTATVYVAFDTAAVAAPTAGQIVLQPATGANPSSIQFEGPGTPHNAINIIASAASTPVTVISG